MSSTDNNKYRYEYSEIAGCIESEWDENIVNIEYLTKSVVEWIETQISKDCGHDINDLADINVADESAPINAILLALEPDCINGTSHSRQWMQVNKKQLENLNRLLVDAYIYDKRFL